MVARSDSTPELAMRAICWSSAASEICCGLTNSLISVVPKKPVGTLRLAAWAGAATAVATTRAKATRRASRAVLVTRRTVAGGPSPAAHTV
jgi:hypothetical protein